VIFALAVLAVLAWMVWQAGNWGYRARLFPMVVGIPAIGLALLELGLLLKSSTAQRAFSVAPDAPPPRVARARILQMVGWVMAIAIGIVLLGFELAAGLLTFVFLRFAAHERSRISLTIALATYLSFYVLFDRALLVPFPPGALADSLGLDKPLDHFVLDAVASLIPNR
jgi:putative tricarboxylic transport membrane protein